MINLIQDIIEIITHFKVLHTSDSYTLQSLTHFKGIYGDKYTDSFRLPIHFQYLSSVNSSLIQDGSVTEVDSDLVDPGLDRRFGGW